MTKSSKKVAIYGRHLAPLLAIPLMFAGSANAAGQADKAMQSATDKTMQTAQKTQVAASVKEAMNDWPKTSKEVAGKMIEKYGEPDGVTDNMLVWHDNGPWARTIVHKEEIQHDFPVPHTDVLEQFINYDVPVEKFSDLAKYDGSVVAYRTNGEISARCDKEAANFLALNLAHDIVEGNRNVDDARAHYAQTIKKVMAGEKPEYVQGLQFNVQTASAADPDKPFDAKSSSSAMTSSGAAATVARTSASAAGMQGDGVASMSDDALVGKSIISANGEIIGEIDRVNTNAGGTKVAIVEIGGILGIGAKEIELPLSELSKGSDGNLKSRLTRDRLEALPEAASE